jgi:hypothetical protein
MYDCLSFSLSDDTFAPRPPRHPSPGQTTESAAVPVRRLDVRAACQRYPGRNWLHACARPGEAASLAKLREIALYFEAEIVREPDGALWVLGLGLHETLALTERFGGRVAITGFLAGNARHA